MSKNLNGVFPPVTTPFDADGRLLTDRLADGVLGGYPQVPLQSLDAEQSADLAAIFKAAGALQTGWEEW